MTAKLAPRELSTEDFLEYWRRKPRRIRPVPRPRPDWWSVRALFARALANGAVRTGMGSCTWDCSGDCEQPYSRDIYSRPPRSQTSKHVVVGRKTRTTLIVTLKTRCRRCRRCCNVKRNLWHHRAKAEIAQSSRTWFGTMTFRPEERFRITAEVRRKVGLSGDDFEALPVGRRAVLIHAVASREVTNFFKRVRAASGAPLRKLVVVELHPTSGWIHYHCLIHEVSHTQQVREKMLSSQWHSGFSKWKLAVGPNAAHYVAKYLASPDVNARVRASPKYGELAALPVEVGEALVEHRAMF